MDSIDYETIHDELFALLEQRKIKELRQTLAEMNEFDISEFLGEIWEEDTQRMAMVFRLLSKEIAAAVFANLEVEEQETIINSITDTELAGIIEELYVDDAVDMMEELPANVVKRVMRTATPETRNLINQYLKYPENSAGSIMTAEFVDLKKYMSVREAFARIRKIGEDKETIYVCYVTSAKRKLEGVITVKKLLLSDDDTILEDIMDRNVIYATTTDDQEEVSEQISDYDLIAIPVVDKEGCLVGIVTVDDVIDVMEQEATEDIEKMAGITPSDKPYSRTSAVDIWKNRIPWLMFLMLSATFTGMIVTHFEDALATQVALAAFMPMLMGTGGNSGSQASTAVIRSLSLGDIEPADVLKVIWKELRVAFLCGLSLAAANFIKMLLVDRMLLNNDAVTLMVAATVSLTIVFVVMFAKVVGSTLPIVAEKIGVDPAVMASPLISTITDAVSLLIYFTIAKALLHF
ncbi:MAG: magnesium transporter [Oscillospiraceae bacterium]|nr:magnesium transporter [Clostridiales bacterium]MDD6107301.1 magnesium transporter [Clostridiales bacterium]MDY5594910.1 magnesium transporter [Oscillospiraceae bacterium]MDY6096138.1 magnesium transporter [Oscillospiraceae bacterium]